MKPFLLSRLVPVAAAAVLFMAPVSAGAQDITDAHLQAARDAINALHVTDQFDAVLPGTAQQLQGQLVQKNPDMADTINKVVEEKVIEMVSRRADLEKEIAQVYARSFSEQNLKDIAAFYRTEAGKKLLSEGPIATREMMKAAEIWQQGVARDLAQNVGEELAKDAAAQEKPAEGDQKAQ
ncbi:hypothetical protein CSC94_12865 [Zhengella mangrovi]|uniref:DUF2059 domain-containing protein n=1 Tax=Zhengella mangrovi TaxID=1982044 RepID=A0A2G1QM74_9HYPH|nr:DUF2059 domain-containing protein [Zhengella mangrovi]PHP66574.1 hypothetical protein CSC94_12865 [Zhengella mangrovi]